MDPGRWEELRTWYRGALSRRAASLEALLPAVAADPPDLEAERRVVDIAQALTGSGGTYGFPAVSEGAGVVATGPRDRLLPGLLGLIDLLRDVASGGDGARHRAGHWLRFAAGVAPEMARDDGASTPDVHEGWQRIANVLGIDQDEVARRIASRLRIDVADLAAYDRFATNLVPPALALEHRLLPLTEEGNCILAASANPTDVAAMATLQRATGREARLDVIPPATLDRLLADRYGEPTEGRILDDVVPAPKLDRGAFRGQAPEDVTILVVDDSPDARLFCRRILEREGFRVLEAESGREALDALAGASAGEINLALVDILMPEMDGRELLRSIREHPHHFALPLIVFTGLQSAGTEAKLMEQGADDYLRKPVEPPVLVARTRALLRRVRTSQTP